MQLLTRFFAFVGMVLLIASCGPEALPRRNAPIQQPQSGTPLIASSGPLLAQQVPNPRAKGDPAAPIVVVEYSDYQWPFCASFVRETMPLIDEQYVQTGKVYFVFSDLPLTDIHPGALQAAHAANCAAEQGKFWEMHAQLFAGQQQRSWGSGDRSDLAVFVNYARIIGADPQSFETCVLEQRHANQIQADMQTATGFGMNSTPAYMVNGKKVIGARPFSSWKQLFDSLLAE